MTNSPGETPGASPRPQARTILERPTSGRAPGRRRRLLLLLLSVVVLVAIAGWWYWRRQPAPAPPAVDLTDADPAVAAVVEAGTAQVRQAPRSADAWGLLGKIFAAHDFPTAALVSFAEAERLDARDPRWPYYQGMVLQFSNPDAALPKLRRAVELDGDVPPSVRLLFAQVLLNQGGLDEAEAQLRHLIARNQANDWAHLGLARIAVARDRPREALGDVYRVVVSRSCPKAGYTLLAQVHRRLGNAKEEAAALRSAAELPDDAPWPDPLGDAIERVQVGERANLRRAASLSNQGQVVEAVRVLDETTRDYPRSYGAWLMLGQALIKGRAFADAEEALRQAVLLAPTPVEARYLLGMALSQRGDDRAAADCFREAAKLKPDHALAYYQLGLCLTRLEDRPGAIGAFRDAVRCKPDFADAHAELGELLLKDRTSRSEAVEHLRQALDLKPASPKARKLLDAAGRGD